LFMKRLLCIRFPNWPVQRLLRQLRNEGNPLTAVAVHTAAARNPPKSVQGDSEPDVQFIRRYYPTSLSGPAIIAVSMDAWTRGVRPGMPLAEARSMAVPIIRKSSQKRTQQRSEKSPQQLTAVEFFEWQPHRDRAELIQTAELLRRYAPIVGLDSVPLPDSLLLDVTGCAPLFGGESSLAESILRDLRLAGWSCRIAVAGSLAAVWALTHTDSARRLAAVATKGGSGSGRVSRDGRRDSQRSSVANEMTELPIQIIPPGQHVDELRPLPVEASRLELSDLEILQHLGIRRIGQLLSLPWEDLPSRLSGKGLLRIQQLADVIDEDIQPLPEANPIAAEWSSDEPAFGMNDFRYILQHLTEQLAGQLLRRHVACSRVSCEFRCAAGVTVRLQGSVVKPTQSAELLHEVLGLKLESELTLASLQSQLPASAVAADSNVSNANPTTALLLSSPVFAVRLVAVSAPIPPVRQKDLFSRSQHLVPEEELSALIARLSSRLGSNAVMRVTPEADVRPEHSVRYLPLLPPDTMEVSPGNLDAALQFLAEPSGSDSTAAACLNPRPVRLLATPIPVATQDVVDGMPRRLLCDGRPFELCAISSAERLQTGWWTDSPCHRDYHQAIATSGSRFWIFRDLPTDAWFVHGVFD
jgi:protein ImuB